MGDVMAIVSKAAFESLARKGDVHVGDVLPLDRYGSTHKALMPLAQGGSLFLVTVRPPDEKLWLVAVLRNPELQEGGWYAAANTVPITDVSSARARLRFVTGTGIRAAKGALGMSLQTPRGLTAADAELLREGSRGSRPGAKAEAQAPPPKPRKPVATKAVEPKAAAAGTAGDGGDALRAAMDAGDGAAALLAALSWWREQRAPALADLVDAISARVSGPPIEDEREWAKVAGRRDPLDLGRLLPAIPSLSASFLPSAAERLSELPDDPRIALAVATWAIDPPTTSSSTYPFWTRSLERLAAIGDVRVIPLLQKRLRKPQDKSQFWPKFYAALGRVVAKVKAVTPAPIDDKMLAKLAGRAASLSTPSLRGAASAREEAPEVDGTPLRQATTHLAAGRIVPAIEALLVRWREARVPAIADAIDQATRLLPTWDAPLASRATDIAEAWMAAVATPTESMPQVLQYLGVGPVSFTERQLVELASLPDDPRIALRLAEVACRFRASPERTQYWKSIFETLAQARDVRTFEPLRTHFRDFTGTYYNHHRQARRIVGGMALDPASAFRSWPLVLDAQDARDLAEVGRLLRKLAAERDPTERDLLAAIDEHWPEDPPRLVYADWLSERGHPRGELIVLSCKRSLRAPEKKRLEELGALPRIHGALEDLGTLEEIERGIARRVDVPWFTGMLTWRAAAGHPLLSVVETIKLENAEPESVEDFARFVLHPDHRRLRRLLNVKASKTLASALPGFHREGTSLVRD
jgi:uncharacterized protein (TIGR02996 family)